MGRHRIERSEGEVIAQRQKWRDAHNKRRRVKYAHNGSYRDSVNEANRSNYRGKNNLVIRDCRENIGRLIEFGAWRNVAINGFVEERLTFTTKEFAEVAGGYHHIVFYRWHREGKFPKPNVELVDEFFTILPNELVYTDTQVHRLLEVLGAHQIVKQYLNSTDTTTIHALFEAMVEPEEEEAEVVE